MDTTLYTVRNTFESFGDPCMEECASFEEAERAADALAEEIAKCWYKRKGDVAVIPFSQALGGKSNEIDFESELVEDSGAIAAAWGEGPDGEPVSIPGKSGHLPWTELVARIRRDAVAIGEETPEEDEEDEEMHPGELMSYEGADRYDAPN